MSHIRYTSIYPSSRRTRERKSYETHDHEPCGRCDDCRHGYPCKRSTEPDGSVRITKPFKIPFHGHTSIRDYSPRPMRPILKRPYTSSESSHDHSHSSHGMPDRPNITYYESYGVPAHRRSSSVSDIHPFRRSGLAEAPHGRKKLFESPPTERSIRPRIEIVSERVGVSSPSRERDYGMEYMPRGRRHDSYREKDEDVGVYDYEYEYTERGRGRERRRESPSWGRTYRSISRGVDERPLEVVNYTRTKEIVTDYGHGYRGRSGRRSSRDHEGLFQKGDRVVSWYDFGDFRY